MEPTGESTDVLQARRRGGFFFWAAVGVLVLAVAAGLVWWLMRAPKPQYVTAAVTKGNIQRSVSMTGALNPVVTVQVGSYVSGNVKSLGCDYNTEVTVGHVCAVIDPLPFQLIVDEDRAQLATSVAQLNKDVAAFTYAKIALTRDTKLLTDNSVSQDTVDSDKSNYDQAEATVALDKATLVDKRATLKAAEVNLAYTNIVSPVVGTVITRAIDVGQTVAASLSSPTLFLIGKDLTQMQVDTNVSEADVGEVRVGQSAYFTVQAFPGRTFHGKVTQIRMGPITVQNVVTYDVVVAVSNPDRALFPGMTADTHIVIDEHDDVLRVPLPAVRFNPEGIGRARDGNANREEARMLASGAGETSPLSGENPDGTGEAKGPRREHGDGTGEHRHREHADGGTGEHEHRGGTGEHGHRGEGEGARGEHRSQVWVLNGDALRAVSVKTGLDDGAMIEVSGDELKPGDQIIVNEAGERRAASPAAPGAGQAYRGAGQGTPRL